VRRTVVDMVLVTKVVRVCYWRIIESVENEEELRRVSGASLYSKAAAGLSLAVIRCT
jgi:hypothetical protein